MARANRTRWRWIAAFVALVLGAIAVVYVVPILTHENAGSSNQADPEQWPLEVTAVGDDGRERTLSASASAASDEPLDLSAVEPGDRLVVRGEGYDPAQGVYVAICRVPDADDGKPGPCLGGVPEQQAVEGAEGEVQFAPSNWINDDWAWRLFGARPFDDRATGAFTAYIEVPAARDDGVDCRVEACGLYTRNDHTAAADRVQDLYLPVGFSD